VEISKKMVINNWMGSARRKSGVLPRKFETRPDQAKKGEMLISHDEEVIIWQKNDP